MVYLQNNGDWGLFERQIYSDKPSLARTRSEKPHRESHPLGDYMGTRGAFLLRRRQVVVEATS